MNTKTTAINERIQSDPDAFAAALDAKQAGGTAEEQRQAALDAYRDKVGLKRIPVVENPVLLGEKEVIGKLVDASEMPAPLPIEGKENTTAPKEENARSERIQEQYAEDEMEQYYRRWSLARVRNDARDVDHAALEPEEIDDIIALKNRRMDLAEWMHVRFPSA